MISRGSTTFANIQSRSKQEVCNNFVRSLEVKKYGSLGIPKFRSWKIKKKFKLRSWEI